MTFLPAQYYESRNLKRLESDGRLWNPECRDGSLSWKGFTTHR